MADAHPDEPTVTCPTCGRRFRWRSELAGRRARCKQCRAIVLVPAAPPRRDTPPDESQTYGLAETPSQSVPAPTPRPSTDGDTTDASSQASVTSPNETADPGPPSRAQSLAATLAPGPRWQDVYLPLGVFIGGTALSVLIWSRITASPGATLAAVGIMLLIQLFIFLPVSLLALTYAARIYDLGLGYLMPALVKLAAVSLGAGAVADVMFFSIMTQVDFDHWILAGGFILYVILCGIPLALMFMIGLHETLVVIAVMVAPRVGLLYLIASLFPHLFDTTI